MTTTPRIYEAQRRDGSTWRTFYATDDRADAYAAIERLHDSGQGSLGYRVHQPRRGRVIWQTTAQAIEDRREEARLEPIVDARARELLAERKPRCSCGHPEDTGSRDHAPDCEYVCAGDVAWADAWDEVREAEEVDA